MHRGPHSVRAIGEPVRGEPVRMGDRPVWALIMTGCTGESDVEQMVDGARRAITCDLVDKALACGGFASIIVSTNDLALAEPLSGWPATAGLVPIVELDPADQPFHFGKRFQSLIAKHAIERVVYLGGSSAPLLPAAVLKEMAERIRSADRLLLVNNFYSVDFCAFTPASALLSIQAPVSDNGLGWLLGDGAGLPAQELPRTVATVFDVDTSVDLLILSLHPDTPPHIRTYLDGLDLDTQHIEAASTPFTDRRAEIWISGRVGSQTIAYLERETACRTRIFSEERGMRADGRLARGEVRSLLGMFIAHIGIEQFFYQVLPQFGQAAFIDDRVLWADHHIWPHASDRFNSDLLRPEAIRDPYVRRFTEAARACPIPVVLGGHSLVSGGLHVLVEAAWARSGIELERPQTSLL